MFGALTRRIAIALLVAVTVLVPTAVVLNATTAHAAVSTR